MEFKAPYLPYETIRQRALEFLEQYNPGNIVPVDIEGIVENDLEIDIVPLPGLRQNYSTDAYLSKDLKSIYVDQIYFDRHSYYTRYRYTLAHEVGHRVLHREFYECAQFSNTDEWKHTIQTIPTDHYSWFEGHAYNFAGLILVPDTYLEQHFHEAREKIVNNGAEGFENDTLIEWISKWIGETYYKVSGDVVKKRLKYNGLHL